MTQPISFSASLIDSLRTAVLLVDDEFRIIYVNTAAQVFLQTSARQLEGKPILELFENTTLINNSLKRLKRDTDSVTVKEVALRSALNQRQIVTCTLNLICDSDNLHHRHFTVELINESLFTIIGNSREQHKILQSSQHLIQGIAHEIKNPLGGIRGAAQLLSKNLNSREDKDYINIIVNETARLSDLLDRMSGYISNQRLLPLNIHRILEHTYKLLMSDRSIEVQIKRDYDPSLPEITGSESSLTQAFLNLGLNALQAVSDHGVITLRSRLVTGTVIDHQQYRQAVRIDVQDDGDGIDPELNDRIFEPLVSSKSAGTGLGLSICKEIILAHSGKIEFSSKPGRTIFSVFLPVIKHP